MDQIKKFVDELDRDLISNGLVFVIGAGASVASGLKTFRGEEGHYKDHRPEDLASPYGFRRDPELVWEWYQMRMRKGFEAKPNAIHHSLVDLEKHNLLDIIITQNVDGFHHRAGNSPDKIVEIHGTITKSHCFDNCGETFDYDVAPGEIPVKCKCGSLQRPSVVWFGEILNSDDLMQSQNKMQRNKLVVTIGTSGMVYPVAALPFIAKNNGATVIDFNTNSSPISEIADLFVEGPAEESFKIFSDYIISLFVE